MNYAFRTFFKESLETVADVVKAVAVFTIVTDHFYGFTICVGPSMLPTINLSGEVLLFDIMSYKALNKHYQPGDVVICTCPYDRNRTVCKRVIAVGNETILVKRKHHRYYDVVSIPQGYVWLAGDNASNSTDSRTYGPVSEGLVLGKATLKLSSKWPFVRVLDNNIPAENAGARVKMPRGGKRAAPEPKEDSNEQKSLVPQVVEKYADSPVAVNKQLENIPIKREMDGQMVLDLDGLSPYEKVLQRRALVQHQQKIEEEIAQDSNKK